MTTLSNYTAGRWHTPNAPTQPVVNPATGETLADVPLSSASDVADVVAGAVRAADGWRRTPPTERIQYLFAFKAALDAHVDEIARIITQECGKTIGEARGTVSAR